MIETIADHFQANVFYSRLAGHGADAESLLEGSVERWLDDAAEALEIAQLIGKQVIFVSSSTGSTLSVWLAHQAQLRGISIEANIMISPNFGLHNGFSKFLRWKWGL